MYQVGRQPRKGKQSLLLVLPVNKTHYLAWKTYRLISNISIENLKLCFAETPQISIEKKYHYPLRTHII